MRASLDFQTPEDFRIRKLGKADGKDSCFCSVILLGDASKHLCRVISALTYRAQISQDYHENEAAAYPKPYV